MCAWSLPVLRMMSKTWSAVRDGLVASFVHLMVTVLPGTHLLSPQGSTGLRKAAAMEAKVLRMVKEAAAFILTRIVVVRGKGRMGDVEYEMCGGVREKESTRRGCGGPFK